MVIDTTLDSLKIPALPTYKNEFGTKLKTGGVSTEAVTDNIAMTFRRQRPFEVIEDSITTDIESSCVFKITTAGITLSLTDATFDGCMVTIINTTDGDCYIIGGISGINGSMEKVTVSARTSNLFIFISGGGWTNLVSSNYQGKFIPIQGSSAVLNINGKSFDSSKNIDVGLIQPEYGGTGKNSLQDSCNALINNLSVSNEPPTDEDYFISQYPNGGKKYTSFHRNPFSRLWEWIATKLKTTLGLTAENYSGNSETSTHAKNIETKTSISDNSFFPVFVNANTEIPSSKEVQTNKGLSYNPSSETLTATCIQGCILLQEPPDLNNLKPGTMWLS